MRQRTACMCTVAATLLIAPSLCGSSAPIVRNYALSYFPYANAVPADTAFRGAGEPARRTPGPNAPVASRLPGASVLQGDVVAPVEVIVTAAKAVSRRSAFGGGELAYVEVNLIGPFFERGRAETLTVRLVPKEANYLFDRYLEDSYYAPRRFWQALRRFGATVGYAAAEVELYRGETLLGGVTGWRATTASWLETTGLFLSPRSGLLELHVLLANAVTAPSTTAVARYDPATGRMNTSFHSTYVDRDEWNLFTCSGAERPWLVVDPIAGRGISTPFQPCRSLVERMELRERLAGEIRDLARGVFNFRLDNPGVAVVLPCRSCNEIDDDILSDRLDALGRAAERFSPSDVRIERFASSGFEVVSVQNLGRYASGPFGVILARQTTGDAWKVLYGSGEFIGGAAGYGIAGVVGFEPAQPHLLRISGVLCDPRWPWLCEAVVNLDDRTIRIVERRPDRPRRFRDCPTCPELVVIPSGTFWMGTSTSAAWRVDNCPYCLTTSPADWPGRYKSERPRHRVTIDSTLAVGVSEVTFAEWDACVADGGCGGYRPDDEGWGRDARPVINVSWNDAQAYVGWLSERTGATYRLLTESEWERVARAGTTTAWYWGETSSAQCRYANGRDALVDQYLLRLSCNDGHPNTAPVRSYPANAFGLHDVLGNVREWVQDCWHDNYRGAPADGSVWRRRANCRLRVLRGGSWWELPDALRAASREREVAGLRDSTTGFRVAKYTD